MSQQIAQMYNRKYEKEVWVPFSLRPDAVTTNRYDDIARLVRNENGTQLLEIGCGSGQFLIALAEKKTKFTNYTGFDLSSVRIEKARAALQDYSELADQINFNVGDADAPLPYKDGSFDAVVCCAVMEHVVDIFGLMREIKRVCRIGGSLLLTVPNAGYIKHIINLCIGRVPMTGIDNQDMESWEHEGWDGGHLHYFTKSALNAFLMHSGFKAEEWSSDGRFARFRRSIRLFCGNLTVRARRVS